jgi:hypothetical protein
MIISATMTLSAAARSTETKKATQTLWLLTLGYDEENPIVALLRFENKFADGIDAALYSATNQTGADADRPGDISCDWQRQRQ